MILPHLFQRNEQSLSLFPESTDVGLLALPGRDSVTIANFPQFSCNSVSTLLHSIWGSNYPCVKITV